MAANQSAHLWLGRFCVHLMQLRPDISLRAAVNRAVAAYPYADNLMPEEAAKTVAATLQARWPVIHAGAANVNA